MFGHRIAVLDLLSELPGRPFSEAERQVRRAMDRYIRTDVKRRSFGLAGRFLRSRQWLDVQAQLGEDLLNLQSVIALSEDHQKAFRSVTGGLPRSAPYKKAFGQLIEP